MLTNTNLMLKNEEQKTKSEIFELIAQKMSSEIPTIDQAEVYKKLEERESLSTTGLEGKIAIPHATLTGLEKPLIVIVRTIELEWAALDGQKVTTIFALFVPDVKQNNQHLKVLSTLAQKLMNIESGSLEKLTDEKLVEFINQDTDVKKENFISKKTETSKFYVAVTGCPTGIAHTYMAAENLQKVATELGHQIKVETRGQSGVDNLLTTSEIEQADGVIICADVQIPLERFTGKKVIRKNVQAGIKNASVLFEEVKTAPEFAQDQANAQTDSSSESETKFSFYKSLMNGVTHMLPFTVAGGILIALRFVFGTPDDLAAGLQPIIANETLGTFFGSIGGLLFSMMLPILGAYIAFSIANRAALMPGFLVGLMASQDGSGFLGAIVGAICAGLLTREVVKLAKKLPKALQGSMQILFIPLVLAIIMGLFMTIFNLPITWLNTSLTDGLKSLESFSPLLLGLIVGAMMATDMGGPINKAAYVTGTLLLSEGNQTFMAAVMAGGMVPPLAIAISTFVSRQKYTSSELDGGPANIIMGLSFITEGAIPYAANDPARVIPALMLGSGLAGGLTMLMKITLPAPHGGIFVFPLVNNPLVYLGCIVIGAIASAVCLYLFKKDVVK